MLNHEEIRLECLRLAQAAMPTTSDHGAVIERARACADFVLSRRDGPILRAANELAKAVNQ